MIISLGMGIAFLLYFGGIFFVAYLHGDHSSTIGRDDDDYWTPDYADDDDDDDDQSATLQDGHNEPDCPTERASKTQ